MSWKRALDSIDARVGLNLETESGSLSRWGVVLTKAYADFQENFLGPGHTSFASAILLVDGRSEGSNFPNLIVPGERERYGL